MQFPLPLDKVFWIVQSLKVLQKKVFLIQCAYQKVVGLEKKIINFDIEKQLQDKINSKVQRSFSLDFSTIIFHLFIAILFSLLGSLGNIRSQLFYCVAELVHFAFFFRCFCFFFSFRITFRPCYSQIITLSRFSSLKILH